MKASNIGTVKAVAQRNHRLHPDPQLIREVAAAMATKP
jgi:hypothetical protein